MYCHHTSSIAFVCLVNSACLHTLLFVTYFSQSQAHTQSCNIIGHLHTHSQSRNIIGYLCTHSTSHSTIGQCLLYNLSHTAVSLVLYAVDKGLRGRNVLQSLLLILLRICSRSIRPSLLSHITPPSHHLHRLVSLLKCPAMKLCKWWPQIISRAVHSQIADFIRYACGTERKCCDLHIYVMEKCMSDKNVAM